MLPKEDCAVPAAHGMHSAVPGKSAKVPDKQFMHTFAAAFEYVPALQLTQLAEDTVAIMLPYSPAAHAVQLVAPRSLEYIPAVQSAHVPSVARKMPTRTPKPSILSRRMLKMGPCLGIGYNYLRPYSRRKSSPHMYDIRLRS